MRLKTGLILLACGGLMACGSGSSKVAKNSTYSVTPQADSLFEVLLNEPNEAKVKQVLNKANINRQDNLGNRPLHYLLAARRLGLVQYALSLGAVADAEGYDKLTAEQFMLRVQGSKKFVLPKVSKNHQGFTLKQVVSADGSDASVDEGTANEEVAKLLLVRSTVYQQQRHIKLTKKWADERVNLLRPLRVEIAELEAKKSKLSQPIARVSQPVLPPVIRQEKDPFETKAMFTQRIRDLRQQRQEQTQAINERYQQRVQARNRQVKERSQALQTLQAAIAGVNKKIVQTNQRQKRSQQDDLQALVMEVKAYQDRQLPAIFAQVYGSPYLQAVEVDGKPKYAPEEAKMFAVFGFSRVDEEREVTLQIPAGGEARAFYQKLKAGQLQAQVSYAINARDRTVKLKSVQTRFNRQLKVANIGDTSAFTPEKPLVAVIKSDQQSADLAGLNQEDVALVKLADFNSQDFKLQSAYVKDVEFEEYLIGQQKAFNDDVPQLYSSLAQAPINEKRWLFVVGIGDYKETDKILYSKRSAEWFAKVATKVLGVQDGRKIVLLDAAASSGQIKDQLKLMLSKVRDGDSIYFYYSGHGLPVPEQGNAPYLLPSDKIPNFIQDDSYFKVANIYKQLQGSRAAQVFAFMDSCFTGQTDGRSVFQGQKAATRLVPKKINFNQHGKMAVLTAGTDKQYSNAFAEKGHRLFSYYLIDALVKKHRKVGDLANMIKANVTNESIGLGGQNYQTPVFQGNASLRLH